jgi:hypothetical protein
VTASTSTYGMIRTAGSTASRMRRAQEPISISTPVSVCRIMRGIRRLSSVCISWIVPRISIVLDRITIMSPVYVWISIGGSRSRDAVSSTVRWIAIVMGPIRAWILAIARVTSFGIKICSSAGLTVRKMPTATTPTKTPCPASAT